MVEPLIKLLAFGLPVLAGVISAVVGSRQLRAFRRKTGDRSTLTAVLSGDVLVSHDHHREAA